MHDIYHDIYTSTAFAFSIAVVESAISFLSVAVSSLNVIERAFKASL